MKVLVVIVTYNGEKWIDKCFGSLLESSIAVDVISVDNCSTDNTVASIRRKYPDVDVREASHNLGFGKANNIGLKKALEDNYDFAFLLNQDAWVQKDTIKELIEFSENHRNYGIISPMHLNGPGDAIDPKFGWALANQNFNYYNDLLLNKVADVYDMKFVNAAIWLLPKTTLNDIGGFNESYFMYGEDGEYCTRVLWHNMEIGIVTKVFAHHARDNFHYKERTFFKNLRFQIKEWEQWSYDAFLVCDGSFFKSLSDALNKVLVFALNTLFRHQLSSFLGSLLGWFKFLLKLGKATKDKNMLKTIRTSHFLN